jgi:hypothetical protein
MMYVGRRGQSKGPATTVRVGHDSGWNAATLAYDTKDEMKWRDSLSVVMSDLSSTRHRDGTIQDRVF